MTVSCSVELDFEYRLMIGAVPMMSNALVMVDGMRKTFEPAEVVVQ